MIDLILLVFVAAVFSGGFWCGKTYLTASALKDKIVSFVK